MSGFIQGEDRSQATLFPERLDDYVAEDSAVRVIDVFLDDLDLSGLGFKTEPNDTARPASGSKLTPLGEGGGAIELEIFAAVKVALLVKVVMNGSMHGSEFL